MTVLAAPATLSLTKYTCLPALLVACFIMVSNAKAASPEYQSHELPTPESVLELDSTLDELPEAETQRQQRRRQRRELLKSIFWEAADLVFKPRTYYLERRRDISPDSEAWAAGGALDYRTGNYRDRLQLGASLYTSQKLHGPGDKDGTLLLRSGQKSFSVLGEAYARVRLKGTMEFTGFRQSLNLPYVNAQDSRMVPNTFEAYVVQDNEHPRFNYTAGYIRKIKQRNATSFIHMSEAAGADDTDKGLAMLGALYRFSDHVNLGAINYQTMDTLNIFYTEGNAAWDINDELALRLSLQYTDQRSVGDELIGDIDTHVAGARLAVSYRNAILSLARTSTGNGDRIRSPYGGYPGYISLIVKDFNRAGEDAWLVGLSYTFSDLGLPGLSLFANYASGDTPDHGDRASPDQNELDFTIDVRFGGKLENLWLRARAARIDEDGPDATDVDDYRVIVNYTLPLH